MKLWLVRYSDGSYQGSPLDPRNTTTNLNLAATWVRENEARRIARWFDGDAVFFDYENGVMTETVSQKRAQEIWDARGPMGEWSKDSYTTAEDRYIRQVWDKMDGCHCWTDALHYIRQGRDV